MRYLRKLNPEKNLYFRALLYAIGMGGLLHFVSLFVIAIKDHNLVWFNPLFAIDLDRVFPGLKNNFLTFAGGWLALLIGAWAAYEVLIKTKD